MKLRKKDVIFLILSALIVVMALVFTFVGARASGPEIVFHRFEIPVTYEEYGEVKNQTVIYCGQYWEEDKAFHTYYEDSGMPDTVTMMQDGSGHELWLEL